MKRYRWLVYIGLVLATQAAFSRDANRPVIGEAVSVVTDRSLYIAGEQIMFSALVINRVDELSYSESTVVYCELITAGGFRVAGLKFPVENGRCSGCLKIPDDVLSGFYYLRAYTRALRSEGPVAYHYSLLKVVNLGRSDVVAGTDDVGQLFPSAVSASDIPGHQAGIEIIPDNEIYSTRDSVRIRISVNSKMPNKTGIFSISVVPEATVVNHAALNNQIKSAQAAGNYHIENRGINLSGKLVEASTGKPLPGIIMNLSIIGKGRDFMAIRTDSLGAFNFALPLYTGNRDLFLCSAKVPGTETRILVDNDFCTEPVQLPAPAFRLEGSENDAAYQMAVNRMVETAFATVADTVSAIANEMEIPFYGTPSEVLYLDQFVQLPTLEEYFNELPMMVKVRKRKGDKYFKVFGAQSDLEVFDPLVLIDHVAVDDAERVLKILPQNIARIEVVNEPYVKGSQTYGGIISIISKRGDFAGIDLPSSGIFVNYRFLANDAKCRTNEQVGKGIPDTRNTLFWAPQIVPDDFGNAVVRFTTADSYGRYRVILSKMLTSGEIITVESGFTVK
ncbi:MAG TPA: hypothetical protein PLP88_00685 [Bacteroidales bacterium]|nr:hypothetical protein [Bacteroidales bacterium]